MALSSLTISFAAVAPSSLHSQEIIELLVIDARLLLKVLGSLSWHARGLRHCRTTQHPDYQVPISIPDLRAGGAGGFQTKPEMSADLYSS